MVDTFIVVDVETSGFDPATQNLLSIGACVAFDRSKAFYIELKPINDNYNKESMLVNKLSIGNLRKFGIHPRKAMADFEKWIDQVSGKNLPTFVAFPATFDWQFVNYYFHKFLKRNPFGMRIFEMKSYFAGKTGLSLEEATRDKLFQMFPSKVEHTHNALDDALGTAESFEQLLKYKK